MGRAWWLLLLMACGDVDGDGFVVPEDCDDEDPTAFPGAEEICDDVDNDCDGLVDPPEATDSVPFWADRDQDGYGDPGGLVKACDPPLGFVDNDGDCDDMDPNVNDGEGNCP